MPGSILAMGTSDNAPDGAILTFAFPIILFAVVAVVLYLLLFSRPVPRVPSRRLAHASATAAAPEAGLAHGAAVAAGMPTASGGGSAESAAEAAGAKRDAVLDAADEGGGEAGKVTGETGTPASGSDSGHGTEGTEASE